MHIRIYDRHSLWSIYFPGYLSFYLDHFEVRHTSASWESLYNVIRSSGRGGDMHIQVINYPRTALMSPSLGAYSLAISSLASPSPFPFLPRVAPSEDGRLPEVGWKKEKKTHHQRTCSSLLMVVLRPYRQLPWLEILDIRVGICCQLRPSTSATLDSRPIWDRRFDWYRQVIWEGKTTGKEWKVDVRVLERES